MIARVDKLLALRESFQITLQGSKGVTLRIADGLIGYLPMITASVAAKLYEVSYQAASTASAKLAELGVIEQRTTGRCGRISSAMRSWLRSNTDPVKFFSTSNVLKSLNCTMFRRGKAEVRGSNLIRGRHADAL